MLQSRCPHFLQPNFWANLVDMEMVTWWLGSAPAQNPRAVGQDSQVRKLRAALLAGQQASVTSLSAQAVRSRDGFSSQLVNVQRAVHESEWRNRLKFSKFSAGGDPKGRQQNAAAQQSMVGRSLIGAQLQPCLGPSASPGHHYQTCSALLLLLRHWHNPRCADWQAASAYNEEVLVLHQGREARLEHTTK